MEQGGEIKVSKNEVEPIIRKGGVIGVITNEGGLDYDPRAWDQTLADLIVEQALLEEQIRTGVCNQQLLNEVQQRLGRI